MSKPILTADLCQYLRDWLTANGYKNWRVTEGPDSFKKANKEICVSVSPGGGLTQEWSIESLSWQLRIFGPQSRNDTDNHPQRAAEEMAWVLDRMMITMESSGMVVSGKRIINSQRFGSPPTVLPKDRAGRPNYVSTYVWEVESGL